MGLRAGWALCEDAVATNNRFLGHARLAELAASFDDGVLSAIRAYRLRHPQTELDLGVDRRVAALVREESRAWRNDVLARAQTSALERAKQNPWVRPEPPNDARQEL